MLHITHAKQNGPGVSRNGGTQVQNAARLQALTARCLSRFSESRFKKLTPPSETPKTTAKPHVLEEGAEGAKGKAEERGTQGERGQHPAEEAATTTRCINCGILPVSPKFTHSNIP